MYKYDSPVMILGIIILVISLIGAAASARPLGDIVEDKVIEEWVGKSTTESFTGVASEGGQSSETLMLAYARLNSITVTLTWTDEDPAGFGQRAKTNEPDSFSVGIQSPSGAIKENSDESSSGSVTLKVDIPEDAQEEPGEWEITVFCGVCGDVYGPFGNVLIDTDDGNAWSMEVKIDYEELEVVEGGESPAEESVMVFSPAYRIYRFLDPRI